MNANAARGPTRSSRRTRVLINNNNNIAARTSSSFSIFVSRRDVYVHHPTPPSPSYVPEFRLQVIPWVGAVLKGETKYGNVFEIAFEITLEMFVRLSDIRANNHRTFSPIGRVTSERKVRISLAPSEHLAY